MLGRVVFKTEKTHQIPGKEHSWLEELKVVQHGWRIEFKGNLKMGQQKPVGTQVGQEAEV